MTEQHLASYSSRTVPCPTSSRAPCSRRTKRCMNRVNGEVYARVLARTQPKSRARSTQLQAARCMARSRGRLSSAKPSPTAEAAKARLPEGVHLTVLLVPPRALCRRLAALHRIDEVELVLIQRTIFACTEVPSMWTPWRHVGGRMLSSGCGHACCRVQGGTRLHAESRAPATRSDCHRRTYKVTRARLYRGELSSWCQRLVSSLAVHRSSSASTGPGTRPPWPPSLLRGPAAGRKYARRSRAGQVFLVGCVWASHLTFARRRCWNTWLLSCCAAQTLTGHRAAANGFVENTRNEGKYVAWVNGLSGPSVDGAPAPPCACLSSSSCEQGAAGI